MRRTTLAAFAALAFALGACGDGDEASAPSAPATTQPPAVRTAPATRTATAGSSLTSGSFVVPVTLTLAPGFAVVEDALPRDFALERAGDSSGPGAYLSFLAPEQTFDPRTGQAATPEAGNLFAFIRDHPGLDILAPPADVTVGGVAAKQIDVAGAAAETVQLFQAGPTRFVLAPGEPARFIMLGVGDEMLVIAGGPLGDAPLDDVLAGIEAMIETVQFN
jgi:hypothetical protein